MRCGIAPVAEAEEVVEETYGPAMAALMPRQRAFVRLYIRDPFMSGAQAARLAGYSDHLEGAKVRASNLLDNERILKAIREEMAKGFVRHAAVGMSVCLKIATNDSHPQQLKAAEALLNRGGFAIEQKISVSHSDMTGEAMIERIKRLAAELGMDAGKLLGANTAPKLIEGKVVDG